MTNRTKSRLASAVADEIERRGINRQDVFLSSVAANVVSILATTLITNTVSAVVKRMTRKSDESGEVDEMPHRVVPRQPVENVIEDVADAMANEVISDLGEPVPTADEEEPASDDAETA